VESEPNIYEKSKKKKAKSALSVPQKASVGCASDGLKPFASASP
jgi:hypothetical protein